MRKLLIPNFLSLLLLAGILAAGAPADQRTTQTILRRLKLLGAATPLCRIHIQRSNTLPATGGQQAPTLKGRAVLPLQFKFQGFTVPVATDFRAFVTRAYPLMTTLYGDPAPQQANKTVAIVFDANAGDGVYELPLAGDPASGGTIRYQPVMSGGGLSESQAVNINHYNLARLILIAFHGPAIFDFDAWELGFSDAAALVVLFQDLGRPADFDPSQLGTYLLPVYDLFNRPDLGNPVFFTTTASASLGFYRAGMAQAAWLKVWVERNSFFSAFNQAYYAALAANARTAGNIVLLKQIAAQQVPLVEGTNFADWSRRQEVLDTGITTGEKLWTAVLPEPAETTGDTRSTCFGIAQHYRTLANGDEQALAGTARVHAFNEAGADVTALSAELKIDNQVIFNQDGEAEFNSQHAPSGALPVIGFSGLGAVDRARLKLLVVAPAVEATAVFPYNVAGTTAAPAAFYGAVSGVTDGSVTVKVGAATLAATSLQRGVFSRTGVFPSGPGVKASFTVTANGLTTTLQRNAAWAMRQGIAQSCGVLLDVPATDQALNLTVRRGVVNRFRMLSLPVFPRDPDEAAMLGVPPAQLLLAHYMPLLQPGSGVTADRYQLYPNIADRPAPGIAYWIKLNQDLVTTVHGSEPPRATSFEVELKGGWNQFGPAFNLAFPVTALRFRYLDGALLDFGQAINAGLVGAGIWRWAQEGNWVRVDSGNAANQQLVPFEGYFLFVRKERGVQVVFDAARASAAIAPLSTLTALRWSLPLHLLSATNQDLDNQIGESAGSPAPAAKPPAVTVSPTLRFPSSGVPAADASGAGAVNGWADQFVPPFTARASWTFTVDGVPVGQRYHLAWGEAAAVPADVSLVATDLATGESRKLHQPGQSNDWLRTRGNGAARFRIDAVREAPVSLIQVRKLAGSRTLLIEAGVKVPGVLRLEITTLSGANSWVVAEHQPVQPGVVRWQWRNPSPGWLGPADRTAVLRLQLTDWAGRPFVTELRTFLP